MNLIGEVIFLFIILILYFIMVFGVWKECFFRGKVCSYDIFFFDGLCLI